MGSNLDESNIDVQSKFSALQIQRQKFLNAMKNTKHRENETMTKLNDFIGKLKSKATKEDPKTKWMTQQVKFHVDSEKAYNVNKAMGYGESVGTGKNFEDFVTKGDPVKIM